MIQWHILSHRLWREPAVLHRQQNRSSQTGLTGTSSGFGNPCMLVCKRTHTPFAKVRRPQLFDKVQGSNSVMCLWSAGCCCHSGMNLAWKYMLKSRQPTARRFHQHLWNYFAVLPPTDCSAWPSSASRLKPINISCLINKWNSLFSYFKVAY